jgi:hypothetical protein
MRTNSASESARIFCMTWPRWTLIVFSVIPNRRPICLFKLPLTTCESTSRSCGDKDSNRCRTSAESECFRRSFASCSIARRTASKSSSSSKCFVKKSTDNAGQLGRYAPLGTGWPSVCSAWAVHSGGESEWSAWHVPHFASRSQSSPPPTKMSSATISLPVSRVHGSATTWWPASIKLYDKFAIMARVECTANEVSCFKHHRRNEQRHGEYVRSERYF